MLAPKNAHKIPPIKESDLWRTDPAVLAAIEAWFGPIALDCAATESDRVAPTCFSARDDARGFSWRDCLDPLPSTGEIAFLNHPFSQSMHWARRILSEYQDRSFCLPLVNLAKCDPSTRAFRLLSKAAERVIFLPRIGFLQSDGQSPAPAKFPCCLFVFRPQTIGRGTIFEFRDHRALQAVPAEVSDG